MVALKKEDSDAVVDRSREEVLDSDRLFDIDDAWEADSVGVFCSVTDTDDVGVMLRVSLVSDVKLPDDEALCENELVSSCDGDSLPDLGIEAVADKERLAADLENVDSLIVAGAERLPSDTETDWLADQEADSIPLALAESVSAYV